MWSMELLWMSWGGLNLAYPNAQRYLAWVWSTGLFSAEMRPCCSEPSVPYSLGEGYGCSHRLGLTDILNMSQVPLMDVLERAQCYRVKNVIWAVPTGNKLIILAHIPESEAAFPHQGRLSNMMQLNSQMFLDMES